MRRRSTHAIGRGSRAFRRGLEEKTEKSGEKDDSVTALEQVNDCQRNVVVGAPGSGKSTFLEWLQLMAASAEEELILGDRQAIPLLLRMRELDPKDLPRGAALIEKATASKDRADLMPPGWTDRQMEAGRVLFILDGLDETEPELRDRYVFPWLEEICADYPDCAFLVSSRPVGYPAGALRRLGFSECDLLPFRDPQVAEYCRHWCTAVRMARNEPEDEAKQEGGREGDEIVAGFKTNPYIRDLAQNPLMLSAICLVNYFESGQLPQDRSRLYQLCVEGLLHHWDQRRGIHSEFTLEEKLRTCREVALAMQADNLAEYAEEKVRGLFDAVLQDPERAAALLEHVRYRTGLLLERRANVFAFAHLTFQEYLAALAVQQGNRLDLTPERLVGEHEDGRWNEVIALYCGLATAPEARTVIEGLIAQEDTQPLSAVLAEAYLSSGAEVLQDASLRARVLERIAVAPNNRSLSRFPTEEVAPIANASVGRIASENAVSEAFRWLSFFFPESLDFSVLSAQFGAWRSLTPTLAVELVFLSHRYGAGALLESISRESALYSSPGPQFEHGERYGSQAEVALMSLCERDVSTSTSGDTFSGLYAAFSSVLRVLVELPSQLGGSFIDWLAYSSFPDILSKFQRAGLPTNAETCSELSSLIRRLAKRLADEGDTRIHKDKLRAMNQFADALDSTAKSKSRKYTQKRTATTLHAKGKRTTKRKRTRKTPRS